ncbi:laminin subunit alpha-1-like, partial [Megalops cyprinoides]|uniref:laminin subunit alpha-1-like n=1 Tax=Megalops cyprinoides TaxID=118141 RepID=UPI001864DB41
VPNQGLFPAILNLASHAEITANATCGELQPELYCKLVEHVLAWHRRDPQCQTCDSQSADPKERHPITNAIDGTNRWWQSPSITNGHRFHWVTITLDLRQVFQVAYVIVKVANSPRPGSWVLERSMDGVEFQPWQYYAASDSECHTRYNVTPHRGPPTYRRDDEVICTSYYSRLVPLEHGEIHTSLINGRPSAGDPSPELLAFTSARYVRLRLQRVRTLNADLMTPGRRDPREGDPIVTRRYFYSIKDISVGGTCICHGHALRCPWNSVTKKLQCVCEHHTCGESCNECCPGYHQEPWQPGTLSKSNACKKCNCHNKTDTCYYNQTVADHKLSVTINGQLAGGGVCVNCTQHTTGVNCETCEAGFYRPLEVSPSAEHPCVECACHPRGSLSPNCVKDHAPAVLERGVRPGQCPCREGFTGRRCDRCAFGFRGFPTCERCNCSRDGSINTDPCAECVCKENVVGVNCHLCKQGYYNLQAANPQGCTGCFCFGVSNMCERAPWAITKLRAYGGLLSFTVCSDIPTGSTARFLSASFDILIEGNGRTLQQAATTQLLLVPQREQLVAVEMLPENFVDLHTGRTALRADLMMVLTAVAGLRVRAHSNKSAERELRMRTVSLDVADPSGSGPILTHNVELCQCPLGYTGTSCEDCMPGFYRTGGILIGGKCLRCECNGHASQCDINGVCLDCTHNTTGSNCDQCQPGFYGDPLAGTPEDCQRCACPLTAAANNFSPTCHLDGSGAVTCDQCHQGYSGAHCDRCANGYYGDPMVLGLGCVPCDCHGNVEPLEEGHCDPGTGECLLCRGHAVGWHCERCQDGYFGDAVIAKDCQPCGCHGDGANSSICDAATGRCSCRPNVVGERCDHCKAGFYGLHSGLGCAPCNCSCAGSLSQECDEDGRCHCVAGVTGDKCDRCRHGYYGFQDSGCMVCDCDHTHGNCNPDTGECICPPHTRGERCELCREDHWGRDSVMGCKPCNCSDVGSLVSQCNLTSGHCHCRPRFTGEKCDRCAVGFRAFPECTACNCNPSGTRKEYYDAQLGVYGCEDEGGCVCKDNVGGLGCDECNRGTFGLANHDPAGCSPCFCSGVTDSCEELGGMVRAPITLEPGQEGLCLVSEGNLTEGVGSISMKDSNVLMGARLAQDSYWKLPAQFLGNQLLSYGGKLRYTVSIFSLNGMGPAEGDPQVLMGGGRLRKAVIYLDRTTPASLVGARHEVLLTEHKWKYLNSVRDQTVTRSDFMSVLSNIKYILIKAWCGSGMQQNRIWNVSMDTAVEWDMGPVGGEVARLIEVCECPEGYMGLSCQDCAHGYHRQPLSQHSPKGQCPFARPCVPCQCHNHSQSCDPDTGRCQDCQHNTMGDQCHLCAPGYYGKVRGSISDCSLCTCPPGNQKSFSPTCVPEGISDFRCDSCQPGYEGQYCQRCSAGYHGNPSEPAGRCEPCRCSEVGSLRPLCNALTGWCQCRPGWRGHLCEECEGRHARLGDGCITCNDQCTGDLLDRLDSLERSIHSLNLMRSGSTPYSGPLSLTNATDEVETTQLFEAGEDLAQSAEQRISKAEKLLELIASIQASIQAPEVAGSLYEMVNKGLDKFSSAHNMGQMVSVLESVRKVDFIHGNITAFAELSSAIDVLQQVLRDFQGPQGATEALAETLANSLSEGNLQLQDAEALLTATQNDTAHATLLLDTFSSRLVGLQGLREKVTGLARKVGVELEDCQGLLLETATVVEGAVNATARLSWAQDKLDQWTSTLSRRVEALMNKKVEVVELVHSIEDHTQSAVFEVRNVCLEGDSTSEVTSDIEEAERLAESSHLTATFAANLTLLSVEGTVADVFVEVMQHSSEILAESTALSNKAARTNDRIQVANQHTYMANASLLLALDQFGGLSMRLEKSTAAVTLVNNSVQNANELISDSERTASEVESRVGEMGRWADRLMDRLRPFRTLIEHLNRNLTDIRELIGQARTKAASIRVAMAADRNCVWVYKPEVSSSNFNTLMMTVKTSKPDNLLFYMGGNSSVDLIALEMHHGKVIFLWDVGSGLAKLEYPDVQINNSRWHQIYATRFGNQGSLTVQEVMSDQKPTVRAAKSPGSSTVMGVDYSTRIFVGGLGGQFKKSPAVKVTHFEGCLAAVSLNGKAMGLWNYAERQGACRGCFSSPQAEESSFHFDGSGFSVVEMSIRSKDTHTIMLFKTFSPNGLLLYLASNSTRDFLSIELVEGKVRLTFDLGSGLLTLTSTKAYNIGNWYRITLLRSKQKVRLAVTDAYTPGDTEMLKGTSPGTASDLNRSARDPIYIGGVPQAGLTRRRVAARSYIGCLKNVEITHKSVDLMNDAYGVRTGCVLEPVQSVTVLSEGYVQLRPVTLGPEGDIMATFSSLSDTGLILVGFSKEGSHRTGQSQKPFLVVMLVSGHLEAHLSMGEGGSFLKAVLKSSIGTLSDGQEHSLILQRRGRTVTVQVDEDIQDSLRLGISSEGAYLTLDPLYIGGLPPAEGASVHRTPNSFYGCIKNLAMNMELLDLSSALQYHNVNLNSCVLKRKPKSALSPDDSHPEAEPTPGHAQSSTTPVTEVSSLPLGPVMCALADQTGSIPGAHQFGQSRHSHMMFNISPQAIRTRLSLQLSMRTFGSSGILFHTSHPQRVNYASLHLQGGHPIFTCNLGGIPATASHPKTINDGQWHTVRVDFDRHAVAVSMDGRRSDWVLVEGKDRYLDVEDKLYLGGLPPGYSGRNIGDVSHSIAGCVREVTLNGLILDTRSPASSFAVASCFSQAQRGSFFDGTGFAATRLEGYKVGSDVTVALEFRTTALDGVLFGISNDGAIGLELVSGKIHFHMSTGAGRISVTHTPWGPYRLCDGRWHLLLAEKSNYSLSLMVDGVETHTKNPHPEPSYTEANHPIYVGGYPGNVTESGLTTRVPFQGCMRDLRLIRGDLTDALDLSMAFDLQGVSPNSCPGPAL